MATFLPVFPDLVLVLEGAAWSPSLIRAVSNAFVGVIVAVIDDVSIAFGCWGVWSCFRGVDELICDNQYNLFFFVKN